MKFEKLLIAIGLILIIVIFSLAAWGANNIIEDFKGCEMRGGQMASTGEIYTSYYVEDGVLKTNTYERFECVE